MTDEQIIKSIKRKYRYKDKLKDKAWAILSDYVRVRDFAKYKRCGSCPKIIMDWRELQGGHFVNAGVGGAELSFDEKNVNGQCGGCNMGGMDIGAQYAKEIDRRWGKGTADELHQRRFKTTKADKVFFTKKILEIHKKFLSLREEYPDIEYPEYVDKWVA